ncbi:Krueppel like 1, partial [Pseudolycoriella hygida]
MNIWNKQDWIKDILSKSGTEITEIKDEEDNKGINKMVYYTALPLIMQADQNAAQICSSVKSEDESARMINPSNNMLFSENEQYSHSNQHSEKLALPTHMGSLPAQHQQHNPSTSPQHQRHPTPTQKKPNPQKAQFKCDQCNMIFGSKSAHTSHIKSHVKTAQQNGLVSSVGDLSSPNTSDPYQCDVCKKTFAVPARLDRHYRTHTGERPFGCDFCEKRFSVKENLQVHRRIHTKERPYKCEVCGRAFEHSGKLHRHYRIHTGERPHKCNVCNKTFIQSGQLVIHNRTHSGEKPYKCPVDGCGKGFTCSKQLKVHSRTHTGEKPYKCDICFRDFGYNHVLKLHRVQHYGSKCYKCTICDETFKSKKEMEAHIKGHASEITDEDGNDSTLSTEIDTRKNHNLNNLMTAMAKPSTYTETPRESSSEANSDADELAYYNLQFSRLDQSNISSYNIEQASGVDPALLAAVSLAASVVGNGDLNDYGSTSPNKTHLKNTSGLCTPTSLNQNSFNQNNLVYEPLAVMRQQGYFAPAPRVEEFRSSIDGASEIVKRVEAALAGAEPLLTPPTSSPESPDRSSSPESDAVLMANRDNMSLPLRKRKLYIQDNQNDESPVMRLSSVIQFAKAS